MKLRRWAMLGLASGVLAAYVAAAATRPVAPVSAPSVNRDDCRLIAQAVRWRAEDYRHPLMIDPNDRTCDWDRLGLKGLTLTHAQFEAACDKRGADGDCRGRYLPHVSVWKGPRYSRYRLKAELDLATGTGWDGGYVERCGYVNLGVGWLPVGCEPTAIV